MPTLTTEQAQALARRNRRNGRPRPRSQIIRMQAVLLAKVEDPKLRDADRAACARAWDVLEERLRIIDGKPLPGQLRPDQAPKARKLPSFTTLEAIELSTAPKESLLAVPDRPGTPAP